MLGFPKTPMAFPLKRHRVLLLDESGSFMLGLHTTVLGSTDIDGLLCGSVENS